MPGTEPIPSADPVVRRRIDGFVCHFAFNLPEPDLRALVSAVAARAYSRAANLDRSALAGRTTAWNHEVPSIGQVFVKEYRRGGFLRHVRRRHYLRLGPTRPAHELRMMRMARAIGVNVPEPVASFSRGWLFYRGWLATRRIEGRSLAKLRSADAATLAAAMTEMTRQVRLLVSNRIAHVDLHPGNVILDASGRLYLLDFDKARLFKGSLRDLRDQYHIRWKRAVEKHGLPWFLAEHFREQLDETPAAPVVQPPKSG